MIFCIYGVVFKLEIKPPLQVAFCNVKEAVARKCDSPILFQVQ